MQKQPYGCHLEKLGPPWSIENHKGTIQVQHSNQLQTTEKPKRLSGESQD